jgi:Leucine-rich repeat (LRR) protein
MTLPMAEMSVLKELEEILQASGSLKRRETIPVQLQNQSDRSSHDIGVLVENHAVVALSVRYSALTALPSSIDQFTNLREVDLTGNLLTTLPDSLGKLTNLTFFLYTAP